MPLPEFLLVPSLDSSWLSSGPTCLSVCQSVGRWELNSRWTRLPVSHEQAGLGGSCPSLKHRAASSDNGIPALLTAHHPTSLSLPLSLFLHSIVLSFFFSVSLNHINAHIAPAGLISATDVLQTGIFSSTQAPLLLLAKWLQGLQSKELYRALSLSTQPVLPDPSLPPPPLVSSQSPPLSGLSSLHTDSQLQQLNGDIRRKVVEPKPPSSSPLGWLAAAFRDVTVFPHLPFPSSLPVRSLGSLPPTRLTTERGSFFKSSLTLTAALGSCACAERKAG